MRSPTPQHQNPPTDLSKWRNTPNFMIGVGGLLAIIGAVTNLQHFGYAWLVGYMFCFALVVGSLFLVLVHHLFDAGWSVPTRRICENIASLLPWMILFFLPIAFLAPKLYSWMHSDPAIDHALKAKAPLFTIPGFYIASAVVLLVLSFIARGLRKWSIEQDKT